MGYNDVPEATQDFIALADVIAIDKAIIDTCIGLRKQKKIKLPDAIIAATALVHNFTIISRNIRDFVNIEGLNYINPYEL